MLYMKIFFKNTFFYLLFPLTTIFAEYCKPEIKNKNFLQVAKQIREDVKKMHSDMRTIF
jgi:hypothetical protein